MPVESDILTIDRESVQRLIALRSRIPPTGVGGWLSPGLLSRPRTTLLESPRRESNNAAQNAEIVDDPKQEVRSGAVGTQTLPAEHLMRIHSIVENLKKLNSAQCLERTPPPSKLLPVAPDPKM